MRDYSDAPEWATEAFSTKTYSGRDWYYGNDVQYIHAGALKGGATPHLHNTATLEIISSNTWWREPLNIIVENE